MSENVREFHWTKRAEQAAKLVADDTLSNDQIAEHLDINQRTLTRWKQHPDFQARVQSHLDAVRAAIRAEGIALKQNRVDALNTRWEAMQRVIEERGASEEMAEVPGGRTGLIVKQLKSIGFGENNTVVEEFVVDTGLLRELRAHEQQAAQELGQWIEKKDIGSDPNRPVRFTIKLATGPEGDDGGDGDVG